MRVEGGHPRLTACLLLALGAFLGSLVSFTAPAEDRLSVGLAGAIGGALAVGLVGLQRKLRPRLGSRTSFAAVGIGYGVFLVLVALLAPSCPLREGVAGRCTPPELAAFFLLGISAVALIGFALWPVSAAARFLRRARAFFAERAVLREEQERLAARREELDRRGAEKAQRIAEEQERLAARRARRAARRAASSPPASAPAPTPASPTPGGTE